MRKLFIHIGSPKTGTTAIQHFLAEQREALAAGGFLYPRSATVGKAHHVVGAAIYPGRSARLGDVERDVALAEAVAAIEQEVAERSPTTLLLSTEYLWGILSPNNIRRLLAPFAGWDIHVVAYLRRQDLLAQSLYVQAVKGGYGGSFAEWLQRAQEGRKSGFDFHHVLNAWRQGGASVVVRVYEKGQLDSDIRADFLRTVGAEGVVAVPKENRAVNTAPDLVTVELMRVLNQEIQDGEVANRIRRRIMSVTPARALFAPLRYLSAQEAASFMAQYEASNAAVARDFLGATDGVLFRDPLPSDTETPTECATDDAMLRRLIGVLPQMAAAASRQEAARMEKKKVRKKARKVTAAA